MTKRRSSAWRNVGGLVSALAFVAASCGFEENDRDPIIDHSEYTGSGLSIAAEGPEVVVAYAGPFGEGGVFVARSHDAGATFARSERVLADPEGRGVTSVVISGDLVAVAYATKTGIRVARSKDRGGSFSTVTVDERTASFRPSLVATGGTLFLTFAEPYIPGTGIPGGVVFARSADGGATWTPGIWVNRGNAAVTSLAATGGTLYSASFEAVLKMLQIARSADAGETWILEPVQENIEPTGALVALPDALLLPSVDQSGHPFVSESRDRGATWSPHLISIENAFAETVFYNSNPSILVGGPHIAAAGGTTYAIFNVVSGNALGFARSEDRGVTWPAENATKAFVSPGVGTLAEHAGIAFASGKEGNAIVVAFFDNTGANNLKAVRSLDGGATWH